jgi:Transposase, Mutator family
VTKEGYDIYKTDDWMEAIERLVTFVGTWQSVEPNAIRSFLKDIALTFSFYDLDESLYPLVRTTNALERLFREFRTKSDEIGAFPTEDSCLTIFSWFYSGTMPSMTVSYLWRKTRDTNSRDLGYGLITSNRPRGNEETRNSYWLN